MPCGLARGGLPYRGHLREAAPQNFGFIAGRCLVIESKAAMNLDPFGIFAASLPLQLAVLPDGAEMS